MANVDTKLFAPVARATNAIYLYVKQDENLSVITGSGYFNSKDLSGSVKKGDVIVVNAKDSAAVLSVTAVTPLTGVITVSSVITTGATGPKGDKGDTGPQGPAGVGLKGSATAITPLSTETATDIKDKVNEIITQLKARGVTA